MESPGAGDDQRFPPHYVQGVAAGQRPGSLGGVRRSTVHLAGQPVTLRREAEHVTGKTARPGETRERGDVHAANPGAQLAEALHDARVVPGGGGEHEVGPEGEDRLGIVGRHARKAGHVRGKVGRGRNRHDQTAAGDSKGHLGHVGGQRHDAADRARRHRLPDLVEHTPGRW